MGLLFYGFRVGREVILGRDKVVVRLAAAVPVFAAADVEDGRAILKHVAGEADDCLAVMLPEIGRDGFDRTFERRRITDENRQCLVRRGLLQPEQQLAGQLAPLTRIGARDVMDADFHDATPGAIGRFAVAVGGPGEGIAIITLWAGHKVLLYFQFGPREM
jgi:hypothetical protein